MAGLTSSPTTDRSALLKSWIAHESHYHWGGNRKHYQQTSFRMNEGGADEHGSLSFSQLLYGHRFGQTPCAAHADANLNLYDPSDNVKMFVIHTASDAQAGTGQASCKGLMYRGFNVADQTLDKTFSADTGRINKSPGNVDDLRGYRHAKANAVAIAASEDNYDVLAKAILGYNAGESYADKYSWAKFLKYKEYDPNSSRNLGRICHSCRYSLEIRKETFGVAHLRTYIWKGGEEQKIVTEDNPNTPENEEISKTVDWCFAYGEKEWMSGVSWSDTKYDAQNKDDKGRPKKAIGRINCK